MTSETTLKAAATINKKERGIKNAKKTQQTATDIRSIPTLKREGVENVPSVKELLSHGDGTTKTLWEDLQFPLCLVFTFVVSLAFVVFVILPMPRNVPVHKLPKFD